MRIENPSSTIRPARARARRAARFGLTAGALVAAWVATGAPIHLGMIEDIVNGIVP